MWILARTKKMANTYTQIYIQVVFAVQGRYTLIRKEYKGRVAQIYNRHYSQ